jgi:hypothetical protein
MRNCCFCCFLSRFASRGVSALGTGGYELLHLLHLLRQARDGEVKSAYEREGGAINAINAIILFLYVF